MTPSKCNAIIGGDKTIWRTTFPLGSHATWLRGYAYVASHDNKPPGYQYLAALFNNWVSELRHDTQLWINTGLSTTCTAKNSQWHPVRHHINLQYHERTSVLQARISVQHTRVVISKEKNHADMTLTTRFYMDKYIFYTRAYGQTGRTVTNIFVLSMWSWKRDIIGVCRSRRTHEENNWRRIMDNLVVWEGQAGYSIHQPSRFNRSCSTFSLEFVGVQTEVSTSSVEWCPPLSLLGHTEILALQQYQPRRPSGPNAPNSWAHCVSLTSMWVHEMMQFLFEWKNFCSITTAHYI